MEIISFKIWLGSEAKCWPADYKVRGSNPGRDRLFSNNNDYLKATYLLNYLTDINADRLISKLPLISHHLSLLTTIHALLHSRETFKFDRYLLDAFATNDKNLYTRHQTFTAEAYTPPWQNAGRRVREGRMHFGMRDCMNDNVAMHAVIVSVKMGAMRAWD